MHLDSEDTCLVFLSMIPSCKPFAIYLREIALEVRIWDVSQAASPSKQTLCSIAREKRRQRLACVSWFISLGRLPTWNLRSRPSRPSCSSHLPWLKMVDCTGASEWKVTIAKWDRNWTVCRYAMDAKIKHAVLRVFPSVGMAVDMQKSLQLVVFSPWKWEMAELAKYHVFPVACKLSGTAPHSSRFHGVKAGTRIN